MGYSPYKQEKKHYCSNCGKWHHESTLKADKNGNKNLCPTKGTRVRTKPVNQPMCKPYFVGGE